MTRSAGAKRAPAPPAPMELTLSLLHRRPLPAQQDAKGKDARGSVLVVGGSDQTPGGVLLAGEAALRAGAGKLQLATSRGAARGLALAVPEARVLALATSRKGQLARSALADLADDWEGLRAVLLGPGMTDARGAEAMFGRKKLLDPDTALVVDAGALGALAVDRRITAVRADRLLLTPNPGEMAKLMGQTREQIEARPIEAARELAARVGGVVALRDADTTLAASTGEAFVFRGGHPGLGTSGSGDVFAGLAAGLCARGADALTAALWAVWIHGRVGERLAREIGPTGYLAREIAAAIPAELARATADRGRSKGAPRPAG